MCCRVSFCCCCFNLQRGVQVAGVLFTILSIISLIITIVSLTKTNTYVNDCVAANSAQVNAATDANDIIVNCADGNYEFSSYLKNWQKNYGAIIGCAVGFQVFVILVHILLAWGATVGNRCALLPYMICNMIGVVLGVIGIILVIIGSALLGWLSAAPGYIALSLIGPIITICILIYLFIQVQSLFKQFGEKKNAVTPMNGNGNAFYSKHI